MQLLPDEINMGALEAEFSQNLRNMNTEKIANGMIKDRIIRWAGHDLFNTGTKF